MKLLELACFLAGMHEKMSETMPAMLVMEGWQRKGWCAIANCWIED